MISHFALAHTPNGIVTSGDARANSLVWMASLTKLITSFCVLILVDRGQINLDTPIESLRDVQVLEAGVLRKARAIPTMRQLLTHTAGFTYPMWSNDIIAYMKANNVPSHATSLRKSLDVPLVNDPGVKFDYGINIDYAGLEVERVMGMSLAKAMQELIFSKLGMVDVTFTPNATQKSRIIPMSSRASGELKQIPFSTPDVQEVNMGGGGLWGTAQDYMKMLLCVMNKGAPLISETLFNEAIKNQIGDLFVSFAPTAMPGSASDFEPMAEIPKKHGLFSIINLEDKPNGRKANSVSWAGLANCYWWVDFQSQIASVCMAQVLPFGDKEVVDIFDKFEAKLYR
jgi:methyl acetate hydrolase